jgi:DNA-binding MarR family transcriptional regulator
MNDPRADLDPDAGGATDHAWLDVQPTDDQAIVSKHPLPGQAAPISSGVVGTLELPGLIDRLHRRYLDVLRSELTRRHITDISASQVMMLITIGNDEISVRHLIERGYYLGSNSSYNLKHLVAAGYVLRTPLPRDRRSAVLKLTDKGKALCATIVRADIACIGLLNKLLGGDAEMARMIRALKLLERTWSDLLKYQPGDGNWAAEGLPQEALPPEL